MARNEEKAQAMLNRWWQQKRDLKKPDIQKPYLSQDCNSVRECEKWRNGVLKDISKKVSIIQNAGLGEARIRELNDEINALFKEKMRWEYRIIELGGPDFRKSQSKILDSQGMELPGAHGYKYFGAAKELPGVRELFQRDVPRAPSKLRNIMYKDISYEYYGFVRNDEHESKMEENERKFEEKHRRQVMDDWIRDNAELVRAQFLGRKSVEDITTEEIMALIEEQAQQALKGSGWSLLEKEEIDNSNINKYDAQIQNVHKDEAAYTLSNVIPSDVKVRMQEINDEQEQLHTIEEKVDMKESEKLANAKRQLLAKYFQKNEIDKQYQMADENIEAQNINNVFKGNDDDDINDENIGMIKTMIQLNQ